MSIPPEIRSDQALIDISLPLGPTSLVFPGHPPFGLAPFKQLAQGHDTEVSELRMSTHTGTHVDVPRHVVEGAPGGESLALDVLVGEATVIDCTDADSEVGVAELEHAESVSGRVLLKTRNSYREPSGAFPRRWISLAPDGARWLIQRGVVLVGIDFLSIEARERPEKPVHRLLIEGGVTILEGIRLSEVAAGPYDLICLPLRLEDADGLPARAVLRPRGP